MWNIPEIFIKELFKEELLTESLEFFSDSDWAQFIESCKFDKTYYSMLERNKSIKPHFYFAAVEIDNDSVVLRVMLESKSKEFAIEANYDVFSFELLSERKIEYDV